MNKEIPVKKAKVNAKNKVNTKNKVKVKAKKTTKKDASMISFHDYVNCRTKKFYYVTDLKFTLGKLGINFKNKKKPELLKLLDEHYNSLKSFNPDEIIVLPWNLIEEIRDQLKGYKLVTFIPKMKKWG